MKNSTAAARKDVIIYIDDEHAQVTQAFKKKASIFGTNEFYRWREYLIVCPKAKMVTKDIKKNHAKKNRNKKYDNMAAFISTLPNSEELMEQFRVIKQRSKIQNHPYGYVLDWFETYVEPYGDFNAYSEQKDAERKAAEAEADTSAAA